MTTPLVLYAFATSPRRYTDLDGPFVRRAVEWVLDLPREGGAVIWKDEKGTWDVTAPSVAALAAVNRFKWPGFLDEGSAWIVEKGKNPEKQKRLEPDGTLFLDLLALEAVRPERLNRLTLPPVPRHATLDPLATIEVYAWRTALGRFHTEGDYPEEVAKAVPLALEKGTLFHSMKAWAGTYFLVRLQEGRAKDEKPLVPGDGMARIVQAYTERIEALTRAPDTAKGDGLARLAVLASGLSLLFTVAPPAPPTGPARIQAFPSRVETPLPLRDAIAKALAFLEDRQHEGRFGFGNFPDPGITAMTLSAVIRASRLADKALPDYVKQGLDYLAGLQKKDGAIYTHGLATYVTSAAVMAFVDSGREEYAPVIAKARDFLTAIQADEEEGYSLEQDVAYGGLGYGGDERPDLSNTQMALEALEKAGLSKEHEAFKKAVYFLEKCQNLAEFNPTRVMVRPGKTVRAGNDGGGIYAPGDSKADFEEVEPGVYVARSYGSMTYALLKSYVLAGLAPSDPRVRAAVKWIQAHYTLDENPGFPRRSNPDAGQQGLYYYYLTMARALNVLGMESIETPDGKKHPWKQELRERVLSLQRVDGSWINARAPRWFEGNPVLATAYALLVLDACR